MWPKVTAEVEGSSVVGEAVPVIHHRYETIDEIRAVYEPIMHAMAAAAGTNCEIVLHDLSDPDPDLDHTIAAIINGHVTGRDVGGPSSSFGARVMHDQGAEHNAFGYRGFASDGRQLRCSSVYFRNSDERIIAALCVNFDVSVLQRAAGLIESLLPATDNVSAPSEFIGRDLPTVMDAMVTEAIREVGRPVDAMTREDRVSVLVKLDRQGATQMRKGIENIAARLGISRVTAYSYLEEARDSRT